MEEYYMKQQKGITVGTYVNKSKKSNTNTPICQTCKKCKDRSVCNNRTDFSKCKKCKKCEDCEHCDKFYMTKQSKATLTIGKNPKTKRPIKKTFTADTEELALEELYKYKL